MCFAFFITVSMRSFHDRLLFNELILILGIDIIRMQYPFISSQINQQAKNTGYRICENVDQPLKSIQLICDLNLFWYIVFVFSGTVITVSSIGIFLFY